MTGCHCSAPRTFAAVTGHKSQRVSFSAAMVQHLLRCSPRLVAPLACLLIKVRLRSAVSRISSTDISDIYWLQASLSIPQGHKVVWAGHVHLLALPAFLASEASTLNLQTHILSSSSCPADKFFETYLGAWQNILYPFTPGLFYRKVTVVLRSTRHYVCSNSGGA